MMPELISQTSSMGAGTVVNTTADGVLVRVGTRLVTARSAVYPAYDPRPDDRVLVAEATDGAYVIGVLEARGPLKLDHRGDVEIRAIGGRLTLFSTRAVITRAPRVDIRARKLDVAARTVNELFHEAYRRVRDTFSLRLGRSHTVVEESYHLQADRIVEIADKDVRIDGESINLG